MGFDYSTLLLIYLCSQELLKDPVLWGKEGELRQCFSYEKWKFIFLYQCY